MSINPAATDSASSPATTTERRHKTRPSKPRPDRQPPYAVILHNDDLNGMDYVIQTLQKVFAYNEQRAVWLTLQAHTKGRVVVWTGMREHAEFKADRLVADGPDPIMVHHGAQPLRVTIEPIA